METKLKIIDLARLMREANILAIKYGHFTHIFFTDCSGLRLIFDSPEVRQCNNDCLNCGVYKIVNQEGRDSKYVNFAEASDTEKEKLGHHNFLNCQTLDSYHEYYKNVLLYEANSQAEIEEQVDLLLEMKIVFSPYSPVYDLEYNFKRSVINSVVAKCDKNKKRIILYQLLLRNFSLN